MIYIITYKDNLKNNLSVIDKIYAIPKKNIEKIPHKLNDFKYFKYLILNKLFEIFREIGQNAENKINTKDQKENQERMNYYLVNKNLLKFF